MTKEIHSSVLVVTPHQKAEQDLAAAIALIEQLPIPQQRQLAQYLNQKLSSETEDLKQFDQVPVEKSLVYPLGLISTHASGWKQEKRVSKERKNGTVDVYIEYWFNCELWSVKDQQWKHKSCYICQHKEGRSPGSSAARKLNLLHQQLTNKRPFHETLQLLSKQHKLEQWLADLQ